MYWKIYLAVIAAASLVTFCLYAADKQRAKHDGRRISEKTLLLCSLFFGAAGGGAAMLICRHKTRHWYFAAVNTVSLLLHAGLFFVLYFL